MHLFTSVGSQEVTVGNFGGGVHGPPPPPGPVQIVKLKSFPSSRSKCTILEFQNFLGRGGCRGPPKPPIILVGVPTSDSWMCSTTSCDSTGAGILDTVNQLKFRCSKISRVANSLYFAHFIRVPKGGEGGGVPIILKGAFINYDWSLTSCFCAPALSPFLSIYHILVVSLS